MAGLMHVDIERLRDAGPGLAALAAEVTTLLRALGSSLDAEGSCWGRDETGRAFAAGYLPAAARVREAFGELAGGVTDAAGAVAWVADNTDAAEDRAQRRLLERG